jgi:hypothetical protein
MFTLDRNTCSLSVGICNGQQYSYIAQITGWKWASINWDQVGAAIHSEFPDITYANAYNYVIAPGVTFAATDGMSLLPEAGSLSSFVPELVTVSRWGRPGLEEGDWVMNGPKNNFNYVRSFKWENWPLSDNVPAPPESGEEFLVPASSVKWPSTFWSRDGWWKALLFGQRIYKP